MAEEIKYPHSTEVLCPNCFKENVTQDNKSEATCKGCGQEYKKEDGSNTLKFK